MKTILILNTNKMAAMALLRERHDYNFMFIVEKSYEKLHVDVLNCIFVSDIGSFDIIKKIVSQLVKEFEVENIIPLHEKSVLPAAMIRSIFNFPGMKFDEANCFVNKLKMKQEFSQANLPCANVRIMIGETKTYLEKLSNKKVIKPIYGASSIATMMLDPGCHSELYSALKMVHSTEESFIIENYLEVKNEYHCDSIFINGKVDFVSIAKYFNPVLEFKNKSLVGSYLIDSSHNHYEKLRNLNDQCLRNMPGLNKITHLEILETDAGFYIGEVACRPAGAGVLKTIKHAYGVNLWEAYLNLHIDGIHNTLPTYDNSLRTIHGWLIIPANAGKVVSLIKPEKLYGIAGVREVETHIKIGDVIAPPIHSGLGIYTIYFECAFFEVMQDLCNEIKKIFYVDYE
jgi:hypothetical protein